MKNETLGLEGMEVSEMIRELRIEKGVRQEILYDGLCKRKVYFQLENGDVIMDELLSERLFSRLHVQYRLLDIMLSDENFWQKECRYEINLQIRKRRWEKAEELLKEYEVKAPQTNLHKQYVLARRAEILFKTGQERLGEWFREALELTMTVSELESRMNDSGVVAEDELWIYLRYRNCENPFSVEEYKLFIERVEEMFLTAQIYPEVYFEAAYQYAQALWEKEEYMQCRDICDNAVGWLKRGIKSFYLAEFHFLSAVAGMKLRPDAENERELFQQCKMAYYVSLSFGEKETAEKIKEYCGEEYQWHITD